jgi:uncharacterized protein
MHIREIRRYPVKSMAGGRVLTSRTHPRLLGLKTTLDGEGRARISGRPWDSPEALALLREATGMQAKLVHTGSVERFDILPLLVATDGAIEQMHSGGRRLRPNVVVAACRACRQVGT